MKNDFLEYYGEHSISPVRQNLKNFEVHLERRKKLYRQCGVPVLAFRDAEILEVGPGGGYNTLGFFQWNARHVDLVEANPQGIDDMQRLFEEHKIAKDKYSIYINRIEEFKTDKKYDILIAEGFLPNIYNQNEVINKLQNLVASDGIIVVTCIDDVCMFIETVKRLIGIFLSKDIERYDDKVEYLIGFFEPQLKKLRGVSRNAKEWVQDQILNPAGINGMELSLIQAIEYFGEGFDVLGCSPQMFTDYSWYKDIWYDYKKDYDEQFKKKRMSLLQANTSEIILPIEKVDQLVEHFVSIKKLAAQYEKTLDMDYIESIINEMDIMWETVSQYLMDSFINVFQEIKDVLCHMRNGKEVTMDKYIHFFEAFGRTQQYIAFVKKGDEE